MVSALTMSGWGEGCHIHTNLFFKSIFLFFGIYMLLFMYLCLLVVLGLRCCPRAFSGCTVPSLRGSSPWGAGSRHAGSCRCSAGTQEL